MNVPRPAPDEVIIAACDADGARTWVTVSKHNADLIGQLLPFLAEAQQKLHERKVI